MRSLFRLFAIFLAIHLSNAYPRATPQKSYQSGSRLNKRATQNTQYVAYATAGINQLQTWYDAATGLWGNEWWNSANVVTMLADFVDFFPSQATAVTSQVFPTTLARAPSMFPGFINGFYDDELWWVLAWIKVFDVTGDANYLNTAAAIFENAKSAWGSSPCGGLWWDKAHTGVGAVENELYLTAAAKLANRRPGAPSPMYYFNEAINAYTWFINSGLINSQNLINNGLLMSNCENDGNIVFTYNQGIILSGLTELSWATGDSKYDELANTLALAGIEHFTDANGILHEPCEATGCDGDEQQFKGIFGRNIQFMVNRANNMPPDTKATYTNFLRVNANAIWANDQAENQLGLVWSGPSGASTVQTQSSALDVIVGAACVS